MVKREEMNRWPHLRNLPIPQVRTSDIKLLTGQDCPQALAPLRTVLGAQGEPFAVRTCLGWTVNGPIAGKASEQEPVLSCTQATSLACNVRHVNRTDDLLRPPSVCHQPKEHVSKKFPLEVVKRRSRPTKRNLSPELNLGSEAGSSKSDVRASRRRVTQHFKGARWFTMLTCFLLSVQLLQSQSLKSTEKIADNEASRGWASWRLYGPTTVECWEEQGRLSRNMMDWWACKTSGLKMGECHYRTRSDACSTKQRPKTAACHKYDGFLNGPCGPFVGEDVAGSSRFPQLKPKEMSHQKHTPEGIEI